MTYSLQQLQADVMALLGENARQLSALPDAGIPTAMGMLALRIKNLLPITGRTLLQAAAPCQLGGGEAMTPQYTSVRMPCGLYAIDLRLPADTVRFASLQLEGWSMSADEAFTPDMDGWRRQWSKEPGIAGCPAKPVVYMAPTCGGILLRAMSVDSPPVSGGVPPSLLVWKAPAADESGNFIFPESLYPGLVGEIASAIFKGWA